jgi:crotonobetainyl-CoA:carnitine CoA-transferase CaiB-like acyl-CoA transferase
VTSAGAWGALSDLRIIDLTQMLAGPFGAMFLADHGAEVIKVEPIDGDMTRRGGPCHPDDPERLLNGYFQSVNRNKQSVSLDLKSPDGRAAFLALVRDADAVLENFRAGVMERLGLGYEILREINPRLVYGTLRGFGDERTGASPYVAWPAFDVVAQAMGGVMAITGPDPSTPTKVGPGVGDIVPGLMLAFGVLAAIHNARRTGAGQFVDVSMVDAILSVCERPVWQNSVEGVIPGPEGNHHPFIAPFGMFPASDGFVTIAAQQQSFFETLCPLVDAQALMADPRFNEADARRSHRRELIDALSGYTRQFSKAELMERLGGKIPFGPVMDIAEIKADPHFAAREMIVELEQPGLGTIGVAGVPVKMTETPGRVDRRSPYLGEQTRDQLRRAGLSDEAIQALVDARVAVAHDS